MPERYEIRGQDLPDGNKALSPKDIYNLNKNFSTIGLEVFGSADFVKTVKKEVDALEKKTDEIILSVEGKVGENEVVSAINLSPEEIKIQSSKISIEGLTTINENFKVLLDGSIEAVNAKLSGSIIATRMSSSSSPYYYAEVGIMSNGLPGLALYNTQNNDTRPYVQIAKNLDSIGFGLCDANNTYRFLANAITTSIADSNGNVAFTAGTNSRGIYDSNNKTAFVTNASQRDIFSPSGRTYIDVTDTGVRIVVNGVTKASW